MSTQVTRIRYKKSNETGVLVSFQEFLVGEQLVNVVLDPRNNSFSFLAVGGSSEVVMQGTAKNMMELKKLVKAKLKEAGVTFLDEIREGKKVEESATGVTTVKAQDDGISYEELTTQKPVNMVSNDDVTTSTSVV